MAQWTARNGEGKHIYNFEADKVAEVDEEYVTFVDKDANVVAIVFKGPGVTVANS